MKDQLAEWVWSVSSIDEHWDDILKGKDRKDQEGIINKLSDLLLKEYLLLKIKYGPGNPIVIRRHVPKLDKDVIYDIRDYETYKKCRPKWVN